MMSSFEKGISHNLTYSILQDKSGFMWFGTLFGLVRYDGKEYEVFRNDPFDSTSISKDDIISIYQDSDGVLWVGTYGGGLNKFDPDSRQFIRLRHHPEDSLSLSNDIVWAICEDRHENLWVGTQGGLNRLVYA
jgi:ligand-binding sensor domain-containing protein